MKVLSKTRNWNQLYLIIYVIALLLSKQSFSQWKIVNGKDYKEVSYAHIFLNNKLYTYSNEKGEFVIKKNENFDTLKISHLSFNTKSISYQELKKNKTITLNEKNHTIEEVSINISKKKRKTKILLPEKSIYNLMREKRDIPLVYEREISDDLFDDVFFLTAVYIPNQYEKDALLTKIILNSEDKPIINDIAFIPFLVNLMTYDTITHLPKDKIFKEDLAIGKKIGEKIIIDLKEEKPVIFPKEGICVVVSVYNFQFYFMNGYSPPNFSAVQIKKNSKFREYYFNKKYSDYWIEPLYSKYREQCFDFGIQIEFLD